MSGSTWRAAGSGGAAFSAAPALGKSELAARIHAVDWSQTALGPIETWCPSLLTLLRVMLASRERALRFSELFVGILGHDLRNPLSAITTAANVLERRADSERIAKPVQRIVSSADRMERMISQLLDFTRIRLGRGLPLVRALVDLGELSRSIIEELEPVYGREVQLVRAGDVVGSWDRDRLSQLLSNLVANACQHGAPGAAILVEVDGLRTDVVHVEVKNRGAIPAELLPLVFEPLRHVDGRRDKREGSSGLGLGLYITQQIALAHGGMIEVDSSESNGTRFAVELPRHGAGAAAGPSSPAAGENLFSGSRDH